ncbi:MAG: hypothetical protein ABJC13_18125 [Acidobacteriota bacterium]
MAENDNLEEIHRAAAAAREVRDAARAGLRKSALRLQTVERELADLRRRTTRDPQDPGARAVAELEREQAALSESVNVDRRGLAAGRERVNAALQPLFLDPELRVSQLDDEAPFVLFPVRIETKFADSANGAELRVRIFPDDIAVAHHEKALTAGERDMGESYWRSRALANAAATAEEREKQQRGAWNAIASRYGAYRTGWITKSTQPDDWSDASTDPKALVFPVLETKPLGWSDTPRSPVMPDRFAVVLERGKDSRTVWGNLVPDDLPLGPDPLQAEGFLTRDETTHRLKISDDLRWLIDFAQAEAVGMGVRIPLTRVESIEGFSRILVIGLRLSTDRAGSAGLVSRLFESHRYSQGVSIVPQGTPTNNTDEARSGLATPGESVDETYLLEHDPKPFPTSTEPMRRLDGERLADALGLPLDLVRTLPNAQGADIAESVAMNRALWSGTLGNFLAEMLEGAFSAADVRRVQSFLTEWVHGRGLVPALRVGSQPYGVVITSSFDDWAWSEIERGDDGDFWDRLQTQLGLLREHWTRVAKSDVRFVGKREGSGKLLDPFETLIDIVGLQASSVEFESRTGVPDSYLKALAAYAGNDPDLVKNWIANAKNLRDADLANVHLPRSDKKALPHVLFLEKAERVTSPIIDGDPAVPLSETRTIRPYDGVPAHNYISWLATASSADLANQNFPGADGKLVPRPTALLYKLLRVSTLAELYTSSRLLTERVRADVFEEIAKVGDIANIAEPALMPGHFALVDTAKIGLTATSLSTGDYLLDHARAATPILQKPPEAAALAALTEALTLLADLPTARLERLLAEHLDVMSYRLDAWLTGLFARRLAYQRHRQQTPGTHLGAYGWVEDVRPAKDRRMVQAAQIPGELQPAIDGPVVTYANNGGFVQAPSLTHAVTAAVLRNAYLTHAEDTVDAVDAKDGKARRMAVNLSSARVRMALSYIEGLQNGQELGALLGYQLERGLHERHPRIELDHFIYVLRQRFPLISKKLTSAPDSTAAEVIEARNVVNGYDLLDFVKIKDYPYEITGLPPANGTAAEAKQATAIGEEVDRLRDAMDAIADLLLAESVHQVVQGNYARARGAVQALTDGEQPPLPEVVQTPRMGQSLTHRVALYLDPAAVAGWLMTLTPRAAANAPLNHWLSTVLPPAADIQWRITLSGGAPEFLSVASLALEPIDLVLMCGERLGDLTSPLEQLLIRDFRIAHGVADDVATFAFEKTDPTIPDAKSLVFDPDSAQSGKPSLGSLLPLLKALRRLVTGARPLGATDLMRPTEAQHAHPENPNGTDGATAPLKDLGELKGRLEAAHTALTAIQAQLQARVATLAPLAEALEKDPDLAVQPAWSALVPQLRTILRSLILFGMPEALPSDGLAISRALVRTDFAQAASVQHLVEERLARSRELLDTAFPAPPPGDPAEVARAMGARVAARMDAYTEAARLLLGADYVPVPLFAAHAESVPELTQAAAVPVESDALAIESWQQAIAHVRPVLAAWDLLATYRDWLGEPPLDLVPLQLPVAPGAKWIGGTYGDTVSAADVVSIAIHPVPASFASPMAGLLIDEWTELVPSPNVTTGIAMHVNRPNAVAPQALLVAVAPRQSGQWAFSDLVAILHDTLDRARLRAVEPDDIGSPYFQALPPIVAAFDDSMLMAAAKFSGIAALKVER